MSELASGYDQTLSLQVLQNQSRDHPPGRDALCPVSAVVEECRRSIARTRHIGQPRDGPILVAAFWADVCVRDRKASDCWLEVQPRAVALG